MANNPRSPTEEAGTGKIRIILYDLDRTITVRPTFTPFLVHMAVRQGGWRLIGLPFWILAMIGYKVRLYGRRPLKTVGLTVLVGRTVRNARLQPAIDAFVSKQIARNIRPGALRQIRQDRAAGAVPVIVTAAPEIYAESIARLLGIDSCIATRHQRSGNGDLLAGIAGENNYGEEKVRRVKAWLAETGFDRGDCELIAYTDHPSDAPILQFADEGILVGDFTKPSGRWKHVNWGP
ncbi:MAG: HAD-IB family hydrolase [Erythrobacteraceae bacterium]|nr:HAD-IB family hydrolase [Erythrobacteraceae bacterium]